MASQEIKNKCKERDQLYKRAKRFNNGRLYAQYKISRNTVKRAIGSARDSYIINLLSSKMLSSLSPVVLASVNSHSDREIT